jgi:hypothetical protein
MRSERARQARLGPRQGLRRDAVVDAPAGPARRLRQRRCRRARHGASKASEQLGWTPKITFEEMVREMMQNELELAQRDALAEREGCSADRRDSVAGPDCSVNGVTELVMYVTIRTHAPRRCLRVQGRSFKDLSLWEPALAGECPSPAPSLAQYLLHDTRNPGSDSPNSCVTNSPCMNPSSA